MALKADYTNIAGWRTLCYDENGLEPFTEALVWYTMIVGIHEITDKTAHDFFNRVRLYESLFGSMVKYPSGDRPITWTDVRARRGLKTNAGNLTKAEFAKNMLRAFEEHTATIIGKELEEA